MSEMVFYVDVDDTLVRSTGSKRIPVPAVVAHVRALKESGASLYCWSTGGAQYARESAEELGLEDCFLAFLPKPSVLIDDQEPAAWRRLVCVHPFEAVSKSLEDYSELVRGAG